MTLIQPKPWPDYLCNDCHTISDHLAYIRDDGEDEAEGICPSCYSTNVEHTRCAHCRYRGQYPLSHCILHAHQVHGGSNACISFAKRAST